MSFLLPAIIALIAIIVPGFSLAYGLLRKTKLNLFEIGAVGFIFGLIFPPTMIWLESYLIPISSAFAFSATLYNINVVILTVIGLALIFLQGSVKLDFLKPFLGMKKGAIQGGMPMPQPPLTTINPETNKKDSSKLIWYLLMILMLVSFLTRLASLGISAHYFEFDPYFDLLSTESILVHGYQVLYDHSAWPTLMAGSPHRIEPIVPYLEAYWYDITNGLSANLSSFSTDLMSNTSSFYPPISAALLVFVVFMFIYHEYGEFPAIIGAVFATMMPALLTTFIAGEQLVEPWGILTLFFFYATYILAINNVKDKRFAILAGIAFVSTFLGAHYYTVDAGVLAIYIAAQGMILVIVYMIKAIWDRSKLNAHSSEFLMGWDFYKMNIIVIAIIAVFYEIFAPYGSVLTNRTPELLHVPIIFGFPMFALIGIMIFDYFPKILAKFGVIKAPTLKVYAAWLVILVAISVILVAFTSLGEPVQKYIQLSAHFTTPSIPLFATVQEYTPTGPNFDFGTAGFG
ncbi:MAG: hypothetical protein KGH49_01735, partial [Candidatus Micrarchaeota archaeon]|nr:hypothetical protein [Candidatus Micrarchaeota archaeon]